MRARKRDRRTEDRTQARRAAVAQALADAQGRDRSSHESQATGHESPLSPPCCANCGYATRLQDGSRELLVCTSQQNLYNSRPHGKTSRFKGVSWNTRLKRWIASIHHGGRPHFIGQFTNEIEAAKAYDRAAASLFGEYAYLNFPAGTQSTGGGSRSDAATQRRNHGPRHEAPADGSCANRPASEQSSEREDRCSLTCPFTHTGPPQEQMAL